MKRFLPAAGALGLAICTLAGPAAAQDSAVPGGSAGAQQIFQVLDQNGDAELTTEELRALFGGSPQKDARLEMMVVMLDADGSGTLSADELMATLLGQQTSIQDDQARRLFDHYDSDGNGSIDRNEGRIALQQMSSGMTEDAMDQAFATADKDGSGTIEYEEFRSANQAPAAQ